MPAKSGNFAIDRNALHIWPRKRFMLIALPNLDKTFTCTLFLAQSGEDSFETVDTPKAVKTFFETHFPDFVELTPDYPEQFFENPTGKMITIKCDRWGDSDRLLLGDAAHAIVPFFGQGMNCGFEDCVTVWEKLDAGEPLESLAEKVTGERRPNSDAIADMAVENFVEMRDKVADPDFLKKKAMELWLHEKFPEIYINRYQLVTFTRVPYAIALKVGRIQDDILIQLKGVQDESRARELVTKILKPAVEPYLNLIPQSLRGPTLK